MDFRERYGPWAVIAGGSEGVGASVAHRLGHVGLNLVLVARGQVALDETAASVATDTRTLALDLSDHGAAETLIRATDDIEVGLLVYNAGADPNASKFLDKPAAVWHGLIQRNCNTLLDATHHFASRMAARGHGGVVLVTSGA